MALLCAAAIVYALPVGAAPSGTRTRHAWPARGGHASPRVPAARPGARGAIPQQAATVLLERRADRLARGRVSDREAPIPSIVAALATLLGVFAIGRRLSGARTGFIALVVLGHQPGLLPAQPRGPARHDVRRVADLGALLPPARAECPAAPAAPIWRASTSASPERSGQRDFRPSWSIPAAVAACRRCRRPAAAARSARWTGLGLVALTALPWAVPYARTPEHEGSQAVSVGHGLIWYLDRYRHLSSIPFVDGLVAFLPWTLWLVPAAVWWRLTPDRQAYRPVLAWMARLPRPAGAERPAARALPAPRLSAVRAVRGRVGDRARHLARDPCPDQRHHPRRRARRGAGRGRMASPRASADLGDADRRPSSRPRRGSARSSRGSSSRAPRSPCGSSGSIARRVAHSRGSPAPWPSSCSSRRERIPAAWRRTYPIRAFADHVRGSLDRDAPLLAYPDANLAFDFYLDRSDRRGARPRHDRPPPPEPGRRRIAPPGRATGRTCVGPLIRAGARSRG